MPGPDVHTGAPTNKRIRVFIACGGDHPLRVCGEPQPFVRLTILDKEGLAVLELARGQEEPINIGAVETRCAGDGDR